MRRFGWMDVTQAIKKATEGRRLWCVSDCLCVLWWAFTAGGLVFIISPGIPAHDRRPVRTERQQIHLDFNSMRNMQNTCLLSFPFICEGLAPHPTPVFNHAIAKSKYHWITHYFRFLPGRRSMQCVRQLPADLRYAFYLRILHLRLNYEGY